MIATSKESHRYETQFEDTDCIRFERFTYSHQGDFPVRSHAARSRAKMRGRGTAASRNKARSFNGANRRGRGKQWSVVG
ncbi:MAG TPA: hypothetical protein VHU84_10845 [Lacipirellulaceae bacterium]|jgi:hypothetical protein|nr:hypothetical protein [Lacipirellulaceae bacterium]